MGSIQTGFEWENINPQPPKGGYEIVQIKKLRYTNHVLFNGWRQKWKLINKLLKTIENRLKEIDKNDLQNRNQQRIYLLFRTYQKR